MQNVSSAFKTAVLAQSRELRAKATLRLADNTQLDLTREDFVAGSLSMTQQVMTKGFEVGTAYVSECALSLMNLNGEWDDVSLEGALLQPYSGLVLPDKSVEYVLLGTFIVDEVTRSKTVVAVKASDRLILLDRPFADVPLVGGETLGGVLGAICLHCQVPIATGFDYAGLNVPFAEDSETLSGWTCRSVVAQIALTVGAVVRMTRLGALDFLRIRSGVTPYVLPYGSRMNFERKGEKATLTGMLYAGDTLYGSDSGRVLAVDALGVVSPDDVETALAGAWASLGGYQFEAYTATYWGNPALDAGDVIRHGLEGGKTCEGILMRHTFRHGGHSQLESFAVATTNKKYQAANSQRWASLVEGLRQETITKLTRYEQAAANMSDMLGLMMGVYPSQEVLEDDSIIYYWHDKPALDDSEIIWKFNGQALGVSNDGGLTWSGMTADSTIIAKFIYALTIYADQVILEGGSDLQTTLTTLSSGQISLSSTVNSLSGTVSGYSSRITSIEAGQISLSSRVGGVETDVTTISAGMAQFTTKSGGTTYIKGGSIDTSTLNAQSGKIGGWSLTEARIQYKPSASTNQNAFVFNANPTATQRIAAYNGIGNGSLMFGVGSDGSLYAMDANIKGKVTATEGSFTGSIYAGGGTIGGYTIYSTYLGGGNVTLYKNSIRIGSASISVGTSSNIITIDGLLRGGSNNPSAALQSYSHYPRVSDESTLGAGSYRWKHIYLNNSPDVSSDIRLKSDIVDIPDNLLDYFEDVKPRSYMLNGKNRFGYIAQDVETAFYKYTLKEKGYEAAKSVNEGVGIYSKSVGDGMMGLVYAEIAVLKEAELQRKIKRLEARVAALEGVRSGN